MPEKVRAQYLQTFSRYVPSGAEVILVNWIERFSVVFKITQPRRTKLGDFRPHAARGRHVITVNSDLNPYAFLITAIHEFAHLLVFNKYGGRVKPHGQEWKNAYGYLLRGFSGRAIFPPELEKVLLGHAQDPDASSCIDPHLQKTLAQFDENPQPFVDDLPEGALFVLGDRVFVKGKLQRSRYLCTLRENGHQYLVHGMARVTRISP